MERTFLIQVLLVYLLRFLVRFYINFCHLLMEVNQRLLVYLSIKNYIHLQI